MPACTLQATVYPDNEVCLWLMLFWGGGGQNAKIMECTQLDQQPYILRDIDSRGQATFLKGAKIVQIKASEPDCHM